MGPCSSAMMNGRSEIKPRAILSSRFHNSCLSVFDKFRLVSKIPLVSFFCLRGDDCVMNCPGKDPEAESRPRDYFVVFSSRGAGGGAPQGQVCHTPSLPGWSSLRPSTVSEFCEIHTHLKICQNISFCLTSLVNLQEKANLNHCMTIPHNY